MINWYTCMVKGLKLSISWHPHVLVCKLSNFSIQHIVMLTHSIKAANLIRPFYVWLLYFHFIILYNAWTTFLSTGFKFQVFMNKCVTYTFIWTVQFEDHEKFHSLCIWICKELAQKLLRRWIGSELIYVPLACPIYHVICFLYDQVIKVQEELESEVEAMKEEKRKLESHILRTEQWCTNTGRWRAHVYGTEVWWIIYY